MKKILTVIASLLCMAIAVTAQTYQATPVEVSKEKVRYNGEVYYSHIVKEKQTLYSICKVYKVTEQEIYDANPTLNIQKEGLKKNQILLIPVKEGVGESEPDTEETKTLPEEPKVQEKQQSEEVTHGVQPNKNEYYFHRVKWFEDLGDIAAKYNVSKLSIMNINGLTSQKLKRRQMLKIPIDYRKWEKVSVLPAETSSTAEKTEPSNEEAVETDKTEEDSESIFDIFNNAGSHEVHAAVLLPFSGVKAMDKELVMDFYSGALMAVRELGKEGVDIDLNVYDYGAGIPSEVFENNDFVLGPISKADILKTVRLSNGESWIISPVDRTTEAMVDTVRNLIHAPTSIKQQIIDAVNWLKSDVRSEDKVILVTQTGAKGDIGPTLAKAMEESGISYSTVSVNVLEAGNIGSRINGMLSNGGTTRIIAAAESESFMNQLVKSLYVLTINGNDIALYSNAKIRTFNTIDIKQLHGVQLHASVASEVDYDSRQVCDFTIAYRSIFSAEPTHFAYQGYDLMRQFSMLVYKYGRKWYRTIDKVTINGLQSDFDYKRAGSATLTGYRGGFINTATRRVLYSPDYSIKMISK